MPIRTVRVFEMKVNICIQFNFYFSSGCYPALSQDFDLKNGDDFGVEVQFQLNSLPLCEMHLDIDNLPDMNLIYPDMARQIRFMCGNLSMTRCISHKVKLFNWNCTSTSKSSPFFRFKSSTSIFLSLFYYDIFLTLYLTLFFTLFFSDCPPALSKISTSKMGTISGLRCSSS